MNIEALDFSQAHTKIYAQTDDTISLTKGKLNIAIVAIKDEHILLAEAYKQQLQNKDFSCEIFQDVDTAISWGNEA
ncbi:MAG: hypothetical protein QM484_10770 [Woeseiaceae bacterium]